MAKKHKPDKPHRPRDSKKGHRGRGAMSPGAQSGRGRKHGSNEPRTFQPVTTPPGPQPTYGKWVPGTPGVENPPVKPFLTAEDIMAIGEANEGWDTALNDIQSGLDNLLTQSEFDKTQIDKARVQDLNTSADEMAGRGLFQSSLKDADLYDIEATARLRKEFIDTQIKTASMQAERQRKTIEGSRETFNRGVNQQMVQNAQGVNADMPKYKVEPTAGHFDYTPPQTAPRSPHIAPNRFSVRPFAPSWQKSGSTRAAGHRAEARERIGGKRGGRGTRVGKVTGVGMGLGSAGIA